MKAITLILQQTLQNANIADDGESRENQLQLANLLVQIGQFKEADIIAEKYLATDDKDIDFLFVKTNIEMSLGNLDKMKEYEKKILTINPKAFD